MKKLLASVFVFGLTVMANQVFAQDDYGYGGGYDDGYGDGGGEGGRPWYVAANLSLTSYSEDGLTTSTGVGVSFGWRFNDMYAAEFSYRDLGDTGPGASGFDVINYELVGRAFWPIGGANSGVYGKLGVVQHLVDVGYPLAPVYADDPSHTNVTDMINLDNSSFGVALGVGYQFLDADNKGFFVELMLHGVDETVERTVYLQTDPLPAGKTAYKLEEDVSVNMTSLNFGVVF